MRVSNRCRKAIAPVAVGVIALCSAAGVASAALGGNARGIALARRVLHAMSTTRVAAYTQTGLVAMDSAEGKTSFFSWRWGAGGVPRGWVRATEHAVLVLNAGRVVWWRDDLVPQVPRCHSALCGPTVPVEIVVNGQGHFYAFGSAAHHTCFSRLSGTTPYDFRAPAYFIRGLVSAPVGAGSTLRLSYRYVWSGPQYASETDLIAATTSRVLSGVVRVSGSGAASGFAFRFRYSYPTLVPTQPRVALCH